METMTNEAPYQHLYDDFRFEKDGEKRARIALKILRRAVLRENRNQVKMSLALCKALDYADLVLGERDSFLDAPHEERES